MALLFYVMGKAPYKVTQLCKFKFGSIRHLTNVVKSAVISGHLDSRYRSPETQVPTKISNRRTYSSFLFDGTFKVCRV